MNNMKSSADTQERRRIFRLIGRATGAAYARKGIPVCMVNETLDLRNDATLKGIEYNARNGGVYSRRFFGETHAIHNQPEFWRGFAEGALCAFRAARSGGTEDLDKRLEAEFNRVNAQAVAALNRLNNGAKGGAL